MRKTIILFGIIFLFYACESNKYPVVNYVEDNQEVNKDYMDRFNAVSIKLSGIKVIEPTDGILMEKLNSDIYGFLLSGVYNEDEYKDINEMADTLFAEYSSFLRDMPDMPYKYEITREVKVELDSLGIFSISKYDFAYLGGAHPNSFTTFSNYNTTTKEQITFDDMFVKSYEDELLKIGEQDFRKLKNLTPDESISEAGYWFDDDDFLLTNNFVLTVEGIVFYYNSYEIAPYAMGQTELLIRYSDLKNIISKEGILAGFVE